MSYLKWITCWFAIGFSSGLLAVEPYYLQESTLPLFSSEELRKLEQEFVSQVNQSNKVLYDPLVNEYLQDFGERLLVANELKETKFRFFVVKQPRINAFAGPGGLIGLNSGLILAASTEGELAAILAHEIAHVKQKHIIRNIEQTKQQNASYLATSLAALALGVVNPMIGGSVLVAGISTVSENALVFHRNHEFEADRIGIKMLYRAGYDPENMANVFAKLLQQHRYSFNRRTAAPLHTHPLDEERIAEAKNRSAQFPKKTYRGDSLAFKLFQERVRVYTSENVWDLVKIYKAKLIKHTSSVDRYGYALALMQTGRAIEAVRALEQLTQESPQVLNYQLALSEAYLMQKQIDKSLNLLKNAYQMAPKQHAVAVKYAEALLEAQQLNTVIALIPKMLQLHPKSYVLWERLARAYAQSKQTAEASFSQARASILLQEYSLATQQLKHGLKNVKNKPLMKARMEALLDEMVRRYS